ncbi:MAG: hypothetical protein ACRBDI_03230 [Alphaproteobacteria bacterium]
MVSFEKKSSNWGVMKASPEEWASVKSLINHVAKPEVFDASDLGPMSSMPREKWEMWTNHYADNATPPPAMHRNDLNVIFMTAVNSEDADVKGLTDEHMQIINELRQHSISDAVSCG